MFKKSMIITLLFVITAFLTTCITVNSTERAAIRSAPFSKGVNFGNWFNSWGAQIIPFNRYTEQDFINVKSMGVDVIRVHVNMHKMTSGAPDYTLDPLLFRFLDTAIDWAEKYEIYFIITNNSLLPDRGLDDDIDEILLPVWSQVARHYKNRSEYVVYEIMNEPHGISNRRWSAVQRMAIEEIRKHDQNKWIIAGGSDWNSINGMLALPRYNDNKLIYTFHFYDPFIFTHQGASWSNPLLAHLEKIPFPPDNGRMPGFPSEIRGSWLENAFNDYSKGYWYSDVLKRNVTEPGRILDKVVDFSIERNVPVYCGEFGVYQYNALHEDRVRWYEIVSGALDRRNISRTCWEYYGGFGIFNGDMSDFNSDLNVDIVRAMGFTYPMQISRSTNAPDSSITFFDDYPNNMFTASAWGENTDFTLFETNTAQGRYAIRWGNADRYSGFSFVFDNAYDRSIDFSRFASQNYYLEFKARVERPVSFDVRFVNNESSSSIPWRISYKIDESTLLPNGRWQTVRIPLRGMWEGGASVFSNGQGQWLSPRWEFSWVNVKSLEFTAEYTGLNGITIWFDDIKIAR